jgi:hypothetical protein
MHPLDGAYQRVRRARKHLTNLKKRITVFRGVISDNIAINRKPAKFILPDGREVMGVLGELSFRIEPPPTIIPILVGETIYNLRAALDYLVYGLACFDSKQVVENTQFPIEDKGDVFIRRIGGAGTKRRGVYLAGVNDTHVAIISQFQPCYGCKWTRVLREISNPDKHRKLTIIKAPMVYNIPDGSTERIIDGQSVNMENGISLNIGFSNGLPIVETLEQLHSEVTKTLNLFKLDFK